MEAAGAFVLHKYGLGFLRHDTSMVKSSWRPQALFVGKNEVPAIYLACCKLGECFLAFAGTFVSSKMTPLGFCDPSTP